MQTTIRWLFRGSAIVAALLATLQPVLGSFAFFGAGDVVNYDTIHLAVRGVLYHFAILNFAILLAVLAPFTGLRRRWMVLLISLGQYALLHLQLRLGLGSNENAALLAYHIPVGVPVFVVSYLTVALGFGLHLETSRA